MYRRENSLLNALTNQFDYHQLQVLNVVFMRFIFCRYPFEVKQMGAQHNTHIVNQTGETIKIILTDSNKANTTQVITDNRSVCIPTCWGRNTLSVFTRRGTYRKQKASAANTDDSGRSGTDWNREASATYTDNSNRSFIVGKVDGEINIFRSRQGNIWEIEEGVR